MTEVLLLLLALLLSVACGAFVAAEFSLTTVERGELEAAAGRGELVELLPENPDFKVIQVTPDEEFALEGLAVGLMRSWN